MQRDNEVAGSFVASRRTLIRAGALSAGACLLGVQGATEATAAPFRQGNRFPGTDAGADGAPPPPGQSLQQARAAGDLGATSYNGWTVGTPGSTIGVQSYTVPGTSVTMQIRSGDVATVLLYVAQRFNAEVESLIRGQCGGYEYRANVNNPSVWSNHASGTAIDLNWVKHPNGSRGTFTAPQIAAVRKILAFCGEVVYWGQDYSGVVDGMHFEIDVPPGDPALAQLIRKIANGGSNYVPGVDGYIDNDGVRHVFGITEQGKLQELVNLPGSTSVRKLDASNGGFVLGAPAVLYRGGRCDIFAIGGDGGAWTQYRNDGGGWSQWQSMGGARLTGGLDAVVDDNGAQHVFCVTSSGVLWQYQGSYETGWNLQNISHGGVLIGTPTAVYQDGRYDVFGLGTDNAAWRHTYTPATGWVPWVRIGGSNLVSGLDAVRDSNGSFTVIGVNSSGRVQRLASPNGTSWNSQDVSNGGFSVGTPAATLNTGRLDIFAVGGDGQVWVESQVHAGPWSGWAPIGGDLG